MLLIETDNVDNIFLSEFKVLHKNMLNFLDTQKQLWKDNNNFKKLVSNYSDCRRDNGSINQCGSEIFSKSLKFKD